MVKRITREEENTLPSFKSHDEARQHFKEKYGDSFQLINSDYVDGRKVYFYYLIIDKDAFWKGQKEIKENGYSSGTDDYLQSYQPIEIYENGDIHIIY